MTKEELQEQLEKCFWKYARTLSHNPHHYTLRETWKTSELFSEAVTALKENCRPEKFYSKTYMMCYLGNFKYWVMDDFVEDTVLINKKQIKLAKY